MKTKLFFMAVLIAAFGLNACTNDDDGIEKRDEVVIVTSVNAPLLKATIDPITGKGNLENGDTIKLFIYNPNEIGEEGLSINYKIGAWKTYWEQLLPDCGLPPYDFIGYYPHISLEEVETNGFNVAKAKNPDLLAAKHSGVNKNDTVRLTFNHIMHKLVINLTSNYYSDTELNSAKVNLKNLKSTSPIDVDNATVESLDATGNDKYPEKIGANVHYIVAPQNLSPGIEMVEIIVYSAKYRFFIPSDLTKLESGKILTLNIFLSRFEVGFANLSVTSWDSQGNFYQEIEYGTN